MSQIRNLVEKLPVISECRDARRFSERGLLVFDRELQENMTSSFAYKESDTDGERLAVLEIPERYIGNQRVYNAGMKRIKISMLSYDKSKGRISEEGERQLEAYTGLAKTNLEDNDPEELAVEAVLPLEIAVQGVWY